MILRKFAAVRLDVSALCVVLVLASTATNAQDALTFDRLTVPPSRLVAGCGLPASDSVSLGGNRRRSGLWAGLPITSNPWNGDAHSIVATIRERVVAPPQLPDGPPPGRAELARFRLQLADDVEQAYAAIYADAEARTVVVYGVRFKTAPVPKPSRETAASVSNVRLAADRTLVMASGSGPCFEAVAAFLRELMPR